MAFIIICPFTFPGTANWLVVSWLFFVLLEGRNDICLIPILRTSPNHCGCLQRLLSGLAVTSTSVLSPMDFYVSSLFELDLFLVLDLPTVFRDLGFMKASLTSKD